MRKLSLILAVVALASCTKVDQLQPGSLDAAGVENSTSRANAQELTYETVPNELLIRFKESATPAQRSQAFNAIAASVKEHIHTDAMKRVGQKAGVFLVNSNLNAIQAKSKLGADDLVEFVEPNFVYQHTLVSNDLNSFNLWGMGAGVGINAPYAWDQNTGSKDIFIGIIDEGVMNTHEDLSANMGRTREIANRVDDDGNGYIDDIFGYDFANNDATIFDGAGDDHGTHVAGTIGAVGNNGRGLVGVNWSVSILNAKFLGSRGGTTANAIKAVDYFTNLKKAGINIVATNNSWGGGGYSQALYDAIERANTAGILFIAAAGNSGLNIDVSPQYPASYANSNIISVAAVGSDGNLASFSNYGANSVDIAAPGVGIQSTVPVATRKSAVSGYTAYSGTSMATPHVAGAVALYAAKYRTATASQIKAAILKASTRASLTGKVQTGGTLNLVNFY